MKTNLVTLTKFERIDIAEPTEMYVLCEEDYEKKKENYKGFEVSRHFSSMPKTWCEICTPPQWQ